MLTYTAILAMVQVMGVQLPEQFPRMTYAQAMDRYGCDKPDVRYELHMQNVTDIVQGCSLRYCLWMQRRLAMNMVCITHRVACVTLHPHLIA